MGAVMSCTGSLISSSVACGTADHHFVCFQSLSGRRLRNFHVNWSSVCSVVSGNAESVTGVESTWNLDRGR